MNKRMQDDKSWKEAMRLFVEMHNRDIEGSPFKIGDEVIYCAKQFPEYTGKKFRVIAVNQFSEHDFEYALEGFPFTVYVEEIAKEEKKE